MKYISLNFGAIKESILKLSSRDFLSESRNGIDDFSKELEKSATLMKQHLAFKSLNTDKVFERERLAERFINQTLELFNGVSWQEVIKENENLRKKYLDNSHVGSTTGKDKIYNSIHTLIEAKCMRSNFKDLEREQDAYETVVNSLISEKENKESEIIESSDYPKNNMWEFITKLAVNNFNERYSHLSESELNLVNLLLSPFDKKKNYLKDLKKENFDIIDNLVKEEKDKEGVYILESFKSKLESIDPEKITEINNSIISCFQLKESLEDIK